MPLTPEEREALLREAEELERRSRPRTTYASLFDNVPLRTTQINGVQAILIDVGDGIHANGDWMASYREVSEEERKEMEENKQKAERERMKKAERERMKKAYRETLTYRLCGSYSYTPYSHYSQAKSLFALHGGESVAQRHIQERAIPFYVDTLYTSGSVSSLPVKTFQAIESFMVGEEGFPYTALVRGDDGKYFPASAAVHLYRVFWCAGHSDRDMFGAGGDCCKVTTVSLGLRPIVDGRGSGLDFSMCPVCSREFKGESFFPHSMRWLDSEGRVKHNSICRECAFTLWKNHGEFVECDVCGCATPLSHADTVSVQGRTRHLCAHCADLYTFCLDCGERMRMGSYCTTCRRSRIAADQVRTNYIPSRCKWVKEFSIKKPDETIYEHDSFVSLSRSQGEVSNEGIDLIAQLLRRNGHPINFISESRKEGEAGKYMDVTQDISFVHGKGLPSIAKKIESFYFRHGMDKPDKEILQRVGEIAASHTPKEDMTLYYVLTREFDRSREFYCHSDSCWWSQKPFAFCYLKEYAGMMIAGRDDGVYAGNPYGGIKFGVINPDRYCASRGAVLPLMGDEKRLYISREWNMPSFSPTAYLLFNVYGVDGYLSMAKALSSIVGMEGVERVNIDPVNDELWINGRISYQGELTSSFGYLIHPKGMELPPSKEANSKYRHLSLAPIGERRAGRKCSCGG